ncbi:MAG TPA: PilN domain-containing protein [Thermoleophilaceae bacterium]|jgi:Tfp pilus assembly protein PilN
MRPVNLLPQSARPYVASGKAGGGSYIVIGVLAALVLGVAGYVLTTNQITTRKNDIAQANQQASQAQSKTASLQKYGDFTQVAAARIQSVGSLATSRIDYERLLRETSRVLPGGVWVTSLDAEATGGSTSSTSATTPTTDPSASATPSVHLIGCAPSHKTVAATLVRLRAIHGSDDVQLNSSSKALKLAAGGSGGSAGGADCGNNVSFDILVNLTDEVTGFGDQGQKVPATLGGGS